MSRHKLTDEQIRNILHEIDDENSVDFVELPPMTNDENETYFSPYEKSTGKDGDAPCVVSIDSVHEDDDLETSARHESLQEGNIVASSSMNYIPPIISKTKKRIVNSIDSSLDPDNYNTFILPEKEELISVKNGKDTITWSNLPPKNKKASSENIITKKPIIKQTATHATTPLSAWSYFFSDDIINKIVHATNLRIKNIHEKLGEKDPPYYLNICDAREIKSFIGLSYVRGLMNMNHMDINILFNKFIGLPVFSSTMSINRFNFLHANITFDDITDRRDRWKKDKFAAMREVFEMFNINCVSAMNPTDYLSLDETLYPSRNKISFKQYNPNKPAKYGILFKSLNSARHPYTYQAVVYSGKPQDPSEHHVQGILPTVQHLIEKVEVCSSLKGTNITMDRLYTSIELFQWLLARRITGVGTLMANRKGLPKSFVSLAGRDNQSYRVLWESSSKKMSLHSYVVSTKSKGKKNVLALATVPPLLGSTILDEKNKPAILKF